MKVKAISTLAALMLVLGACSSNASTETSSPGAPNTTNGGSPSDEETVLIVPEQSGPQSLNPNWQNDTGIHHLGGNVFSSLITLDWGVAEGTTAYGDVAETWDVSEDARQYTFHIRDGMKWHDGEPVSAGDVLYTFQTVKESGYPGAEILEGAELSSPDDSTFVVAFEEPNVSFIPLLAQVSNWYLKILPEHVYGGTDWATESADLEPIGSGPFRFESITAEQVTLVANPDHYMGEPDIDRLVFRVVPDAAVANEAFNSGEYPYLPSQYVTSYEDVRRRMDTESDVRVVETPSTYGRDLIFNLQVEPLDDPAVRQAIAYALNREQISSLAFRDLWPPVYTAGSPYVPEYLSEEAVFPQHDLAEANRILDEAGYTADANGIRFPLRFTNPTQEDSRLIAEVVVEQLKAIGIDVRWETYDQATWNDRLNQGDWESSIYFTRYGPDPEAYCEHFQTGANRNFGGFSSETVDEACDTARSTLNPEARAEAYHAIQQVLVEEMPYINLFGQVRFSLASNDWQCFAIDPCGFNQSLGWFGFRAVEAPDQ